MLKRKAIIIEFVGPPGAGKTTNCWCFANQLKEKGFKILLLKDIKCYVRKLNFAQKFFLLLRVVLFRSHTILLYALSLAYNKMISASSIYRYVRLTLLEVALKQIIKKTDVDIVLLEQWIIQELWSATIFKLNSYNKIKNSLSKFYFKTDFVLYFDIDATTSSERIRLRKTNISRFDRMDADNRYNEIVKYCPYLFQLYQKSDCIHKQVFYGNQSVLKNADSFFQHLDTRFNYKIST